MTSINNLLLLGDGETWNRQRIDFAGLPEMVRTFLQVAAGAADIPVTRLLGQSPAGLSATGESDTRNTYDMIAACQELELRPVLERLDRIVAASEGIAPDNLTFAFRPLWQLDAASAATIALQKARARGNGSGFSFSRASSRDRAIPPDRHPLEGRPADPPASSTANAPSDAPRRRRISRGSDHSMSYAVPAPADLAARFPAFAAVPPATLAQAIVEAQSRVDTTWLPGDYAIAIMLLAAHTLTLDGFGTGAEAASAAAGALGFQAMRSGGLELERPRPVRGLAEPSILAETTYGRRFLALLKVNQPGVHVP